MKRFCVRGGEYGININSDFYRDHGVRLLRTTDIDEDGKLRNDDDSVCISAEHADGMLLSARDILFSRSGTLGRAYLHTNTSEPMTFAGYLVRFTPRETVDCRYIHYCSQASFFSDQIRADAVVSTIANFNAERYSAVAVPWHSQNAQAAIADFLDIETARIDALIAKKTRLGVAITARVLTSIESAIWAPKYKHIPLRRACRFIDYRGATPSKSNSGVPLITASHIRDGWLDMKNDPQWVDESTYHEWMRRGWPAAGDVLLTTEAPLGNVAQITDSRVALAQRVILLKPNKSTILADFLTLALRSPSFKNALLAHATGSTALGIKADRLKGLSVPVPSLDLQLTSVREMMRQEAIADRVRRALNAQIALLRQRKQALITAVVTGKMDVPGVLA